jgi:dynein heavy chain
LRLTQDKLEHSRSKLSAVEQTIRDLTNQYNEAEAKKQSLENGVQQCQIKLARAKRLIGGLGGESYRWDSRSKEYRESQYTIVGDVLLSSIFIVYFGPFSPHYRARALGESQWK